MIRDQALAACGLLVRDLGGPSVNGYQPDGIWEEATFGQKKYARGNGDALYRRSLYTFWRRIVGPTMFFDNASRQVCTVKVVRTNTPLQALFTLNDVTFVEAARALASKTLQSELGSDRARIDFVFNESWLDRHPTQRPSDWWTPSSAAHAVSIAARRGESLAVGRRLEGASRA